MRKKVLISIASLIAVLGIVLWLLDVSPSATPTTGQIQKMNDWKKRYGFRSPDPNGLGIFSELARVYASGKTPAPKEWSETKSYRYNANYLFVGEHFGLRDALLDSLLEAVAGGSDLLIASDLMSSNCYQHFFLESGYNWNYSDTIRIRIKSQAYPFAAVYENDTIHSDWYTFDTTRIIDTAFTTIASITEDPVAFIIPYGRGRILFHSIPYLFTNVQLKSAAGFAHAKTILEELTPNRPTVWLSFARRKTQSSTASNGGTSDNQKDGEDQSYLSFILRFSSLRWAFVLALSGLLLYVIFRTKRRELILSGRAANKYTTSEYLKTISRIYQSQHTVASLFQQHQANVIASMKRYFHIDLSDKENRAANLELLIERIGMDKNTLQSYFYNLLETDSLQATNQSLQVSYNQTREIYLNTGLLRKKTTFLLNETELALYRSNEVSSAAILLSAGILITGLAQLTYAMSSGGWWFAAGTILLSVAFWWISKPILTIYPERLVVHKLLGQDLVLNTDQHLNVFSRGSTITILGEDGAEIQLNSQQFNQLGKQTIEQWITYIKTRTHGTRQSHR